MKKETNIVYVVTCSGRFDDVKKRGVRTVMTTSFFHGVEAVFDTYDAAMAYMDKMPDHDAPGVKYEIHFQMVRKAR